MPKPSAPAVKLSAAEPGKIEIKTSPGQLCLVRLYGLAQEKRETCVYVRVEHGDDPSKKPGCCPFFQKV